MLKLVVLFAVIACSVANPLFNNLDRFDFDLTEQEINDFESVLGEIKTQLWDNKRIFEVARAIANDDELREDFVLAKLKAIFTSNDPKNTIYETFEAFADKLRETEGMSTDFADVTEEEIQEFEDAIDHILEELFINGKIIPVVQALVGDDEIRDETLDLLMGVLFDSDAEAAVRNLVDYVTDKLSEIQETVIDFDMNEADQFKQLFDSVTFELFENRRIYEAIRAYVIDKDIRDGTNQHVYEIFSGEDPEEELFQALNDLDELLSA